MGTGKTTLMTMTETQWRPFRQPTQNIYGEPERHLSEHPYLRGNDANETRQECDCAEVADPEEESANHRTRAPPRKLVKREKSTT